MSSEVQQVVAFVVDEPSRIMEAPEAAEVSSAILDSFRASVNVKIKQPVQFNVELDFDALTFEHMELIDRMQGGDLTPDEQKAALKEVLFILTGQDVSKLPLRVTASILAEFKNVMQDMTRPNA